MLEVAAQEAKKERMPDAIAFWISHMTMTAVASSKIGHQAHFAALTRCVNGPDLRLHPTDPILLPLVFNLRICRQPQSRRESYSASWKNHNKPAIVCSIMAKSIHVQYALRAKRVGTPDVWSVATACLAINLDHDLGNDLLLLGLCRYNQTTCQLSRRCSTRVTTR